MALVWKIDKPFAVGDLEEGSLAVFGRTFRVGLISRCLQIDLTFVCSSEADVSIGQSSRSSTFRR